MQAARVSLSCRPKIGKRLSPESRMHEKSQLLTGPREFISKFDIDRASLGSRLMFEAARARGLRYFPRRAILFHKNQIAVDEQDHGEMNKASSNSIDRPHPHD